MDRRSKATHHHCMAKARTAAAAASQTVRREDFVRDPVAVLRQAKANGPIEITDAQGRVRAVISVPTDRRRS